MTLNLASYTVTQLKQLSTRIAKEIAKQESAGKGALLKKLKKMAREHGLSLDDVLGGTAGAEKQTARATKPAATLKAPLPVKYRHPSNKELAWSGRGRKPKWVEAWVANGGAIDALATAAAKFEKKQLRTAKATPDASPTAADAVPATAAQTDVTALSE